MLGRDLWNFQFGFAVEDDVCNMIMHWKCHMLHTVQLRSVLKLEKLAAVDSILDLQNEAICDGDSAAAHKAVGRIVDMGKKATSLKPNRRLHGCSTHNDERKAFRDHFAKTMQAEETSMQQLVEDERLHAKEHPPTGISGETEAHILCDTPSPFEAMVRIRRVQQHRAIGEDLVPDELLKLCPQATHRLLYPLSCSRRC